MASKKPTEKKIKQYVETRAEEALKEHISGDELLMDNKAFRDIFIGGFFAGMTTHAKIMSDLGKNIIDKAKGKTE